MLPLQLSAISAKTGVVAGIAEEGEPLEQEAELLTLLSESETEVHEEFDPGDIVEAAEQLLRESAPHDFQVLIIGGGPAGCTAALRAAELGARVGLVEAGEPGGTYLDYFVPSRVHLEAAHRFRASGIEPDFAVVSSQAATRVQHERGELKETLESNGVSLITGHARFVDEHCVEVTSPEGTRRIKAVHVIIATGARAVPDSLGSDTVLQLLKAGDILRAAKPPAQVAIIGGNVQSIEMAYLLQARGTQVTLLEAGPEILPEADSDVRSTLAQVLHNYGVNVQTSAHVQRVSGTAHKHAVEYRDDDGQHTMSADAVVLASGYSVDSDDLGLSIVGVEVKDGKIIIDEEFQTTINGVYAVGGCIHGWIEPQRARAEGRQVAECVLNYPVRQTQLRIPWSCYIYPAAAGIGLTEQQAQQAGVLCRIGTQASDAMSSAGAGFIKVVIDAEDNHLLGCHMVGDGAYDVINLAALGMAADWAAPEVAATAFVEHSQGMVLAAAIRAAR